VTIGRRVITWRLHGLRFGSEPLETGLAQKEFASLGDELALKNRVASVDGQLVGFVLGDAHGDPVRSELEEEFRVV
jgi:hypothetical protein